MSPKSIGLIVDNILVVERIAGIPVNDVASLIDQGTELQLLAERGVEIFLRRFFYA